MTKLEKLLYNPNVLVMGVEYSSRGEPEFTAELQRLIEMGFTITKQGKEPGAGGKYFIVAHRA